VHIPPHCFAEHRTIPSDLTQAGVATRLGDADKAIDPLHLIEPTREAVGNDVLHCSPAGSEKRIDLLYGFRFSPRVRSHELYRFLSLRRF